MLTVLKDYFFDLLHIVEDTFLSGIDHKLEEEHRKLGEIG